MSDTIAAIATGSGPSAIGIIRLSGPQAIACADAVFRAHSKVALRETPSRRLVLGTLTDGEGHALDEILATVSRAPDSYTGEDTAELQCHGSPLVLSLAMERLFAAGARQAERGEFTKRAFLNGKMSLTQSEAVVDLIDAQSEEAVRNAAGQLGGVLQRRSEAIYDALLDLEAHFQAEVDYPEEDIDPLETQEILDGIRHARDETEALLCTYARGRMLTEGIACAIVGRPNAGKSSLLNALLGYERAIVTEVPGTTRDTIEARLRIGGQLIRLIDTAGIRESGDRIEKLGVERTREALRQAELVLAVVDGSAPLTEEDRTILREAAESCGRVIAVLSKKDLGEADPGNLAEVLPAGVPAVRVSAVTGEGIPALEKAIAAQFPAESGMAYGEMLTNARQAAAARHAAEALGTALRAGEAGMTPDAVLTDVEEALRALGELTGKTVREDLVDRIFERFCVGK